MFQKIKKFLKGLFSKKFVHPAVNQELSNAIDDKLARVGRERDALVKKHTDILNGYVRTYFEKKYESREDMAEAFKLTNRKWKQHARNVNAVEKLINLHKNAFEVQVKKVITHVKESKKEA